MKNKLFFFIQVAIIILFIFGFFLNVGVPVRTLEESEQNLQTTSGTYWTSMFYQLGVGNYKAMGGYLLFFLIPSTANCLMFFKKEKK